MGDSTKMKLSRVLKLTRTVEVESDNMPTVYDIKFDQGIEVAVANHMNTIRSGWDLMRVVTMIVRKVCSDCLIYTVCTNACEDYYNRYVPIVEWLSECKHKVSEEEFEEKLDELH